jgi:ribonuclease HI
MTADVTSCQAEISAAIAAIKQYEELVKNGKRTRDDAIILKSDSQYLVDSISRFINGWHRTEQGWFKEAGWPVRNSQWWDSLLGWINLAERNGTRVLFWWVPREWNYLVDSLANAAFMGNEDPDKYLELNEARAQYAEEFEASWQNDDWWLSEEVGYTWR